MKNNIKKSVSMGLRKETTYRIYDDLNAAASKLDNLFAYELRASIILDSLIKIVNREVSDIVIRIISLMNRDSTSNVFILSPDKKRIIYSPQRADEIRLNKHEAELILELSKEGHTVVRQYLLKGKYLNMHIDYETKSAFIENDIRALKFTLASPELLNIKLLDDIDIHNENIKLYERKLNIDLNKHRLYVDRITIVDSELRICNGVLGCCRDLRKWKLKNNEYNFIWIKKSKKYTSLELEAVSVSDEIIDYISSDLEEKTACLIGCSSEKGKGQVDKITVRKCFFKLKGMTKTCQIYILNSNAKKNIIIKNDFYDSNKVLKFKGEDDPIKALVLGNSFNNPSKMVRNIITVVPNKDRGYVIINGTKIERVINMELLRFRAIEVGEVLLSYKKGKENDFSEGCSIDIYSDESGLFINRLKFQEGRWCEKTPPRLMEDRVNNDMQHNIKISFRPYKEWSDNILKIIVLNSRGRVLNKEQYHVDGIRGIITIYNVFFDKSGRPYFEGLLEPGRNYIMIKARGFEDNWLCQSIRPIQVIEVKNGIGKAVTKIMDRGLYNLKAAVISNDKKIVLKRPVELKIR